MSPNGRGLYRLIPRGFVVAIATALMLFSGVALAEEKEKVLSRSLNSAALVLGM